MRKKIFLLCLLAFAFFVPATAKANTSNFEVDNEGCKLIHTYEELKAAAQDGDITDRFRLANDIQQSDQDNNNYIIINHGYLDLDLNGYTLERTTYSIDPCLIQVYNDGILELRDSSAQKTGTIKYTNQIADSYSIIKNGGGTLRIYSGNYIVPSPINTGCDGDVLRLESGQTSIYDGYFDCRKTSGDTIELNQYNFYIEPPHCDIYGGKFYSKYNNIQISPNGSYLEHGSIYSTVYVMGGEFYLSGRLESSGGFSYCNNGWGNVYVINGTVPFYSLNGSRDVEYLKGTSKWLENISVDGHSEEYWHVSAPPCIVSPNLNYTTRLAAACLRHEFDYLTSIKNLPFYETNKDYIDSFLKKPDTIEVGKHTGVSPELSIEGLQPGDTVKWYFSYDYNGETATWNEIKNSITQNSPWRFDIRPDEDTMCYVRAVVTRSDRSIHEDIVCIHYEKWDRTLQGNAKIYMNNPWYGNNVYAGIFDAPEGQDKSTYTYEWRLNGTVVGTSEKFSIDKESYIGKSLNCTIRSSKYSGALVTPSVTVAKAKNNNQPYLPGATYKVSDDSIYLTGVEANQEYLFTTKSSASELTENDWLKAKEPSDSTAVYRLSFLDLQDAKGQRIYIYTRIKETNTHQAGEKITMMPLDLKDVVYLQTILYPEALNNTIYIPFHEKGEQVIIDYKLNPINANQWTGLTWRLNSSNVVTMVSPTGTVTPSNDTGQIRLSILGTGGTNLSVMMNGYPPTQISNVSILVYDPKNPQIGSANVVYPLPDRTLTVGTTYIAEPPAMIPEPPEDMELFWVITERDAGSYTYNQCMTDCDVASINSETGEITAKAPGSVYISLVKDSQNQYYCLDTFKLTVINSDEYIFISQVLLDNTELTIMSKETAQLTAVAVPANATEQEVTWTSSNPMVATVDRNGVVHAISKGTAEITARVGGIYYYKTAKCSVTVTANPLEVTGQEPPKTENPFSDVAESAYYYAPVLWAVENDITSGISATLFGPDTSCTRAQAVTFLWRAYGKPEPVGNSNPFKDVKSSDYYYDAVLWAVENGITAGVSPTSFSPNSRCTRGQIVSFLWRSAGEPEPKGESNPFRDVKSTDYYYDAVLWAVENGITAGSSVTTFSPNSYCTRAQIVTFLYRYMTN